MNKKIFVLLCLLSLAACMKISHEYSDSPETERIPSTTTTALTTQPTQPKGPLDFSKMSPEEQQAYMRMFQFMSNNSQIAKAMASGKEPTDDQLRLLMQFMVSDKYFQKMLINDISKLPENDWLAKVPRNGQVRFLKIVTSIPASKTSDQKVMNAVSARLLADKDIGPALRRKYGKNVPASALSSVQSSVSSGIASHFSAMLTHPQ